MIGSHNWIEADSSNTRDDLYVTGDASTMNMDLFLAAYNSVPGNVITMDDLAARAAKRFDESVATNPYFYYGPYTGLIARNAGYAFAGRMLSNHSKEFPGGQFSKSYAPLAKDGGRTANRKQKPRMFSNLSSPSSRRTVSSCTRRATSASRKIGTASRSTTPSPL